MDDTLNGWYLIEQMGHKRVAGYVTQVALAGQGMLRVDVPGSVAAEAMTQLIHPGTLYALTPITEDLARQLAVRFHLQPVSIYDLPRPALPSYDVNFGDVTEIPHPDESDATWPERS